MKKHRFYVLKQKQKGARIRVLFLFSPLPLLLRFSIRIVRGRDQTVWGTVLWTLK